MNTPRSELTPKQLAYLAVLVDPEDTRPKYQVAAELGVEHSTLNRWEKNSLFRKAWRDAVVTDITKPRALWELAEEIRSIAMAGRSVHPKDRLMAADLYIKLAEKLTPEDEARPIEGADDEALIAAVGEDHPAAKILRLKAANGG